MRFYNIDGAEEDVQDPKFFLDEYELQEIILVADEMINDYI